MDLAVDGWMRLPMSADLKVGDLGIVDFLEKAEAARGGRGRGWSGRQANKASYLEWLVNVTHTYDL